MRVFRPKIIFAFCCLVSCTARANQIYIADQFSNSISTINSAGLSTLFSQSPLLKAPDAMAFDASGDLFVASSLNNTIVEITPQGSASVFANTGLNHPQSLVFDAGGDLFVGNAGNNTIEKFSSSGAGTVFATGLMGIGGLAFDKSGNLYAVNDGNNTIQKFNAMGGSSVFATAGLDHPCAIAFDSNGNMYVANYANSTVEVFDALGNPKFFANVKNPTGLTTDASGNVYAIDSADDMIVKIGPNGSTSMFATTGLAPFGLIDGGPANAPDGASTAALFASAFGLLLAGQYRRKQAS